VVKLIGEANAAGAGQLSACREIGICLRTLKRWRKYCLRERYRRPRGFDANQPSQQPLIEAVWLF